MSDQNNENLSSELSGSVSRRSFLKIGTLSAAGVVAASALAGCGKASEGDAAVSTDFEAAPATIPAGQIAETKSFDVVVIGAGCSGVAAALSAAEGGAKVAVLSKTIGTSTQGNTTSGIDLSASNPAGLARFVSQLLNSNANRASRALLQAYVDNSGEAMTWYAKNTEATVTGGAKTTVTKGKVLGSAETKDLVSSITVKFGAKPFYSGDGIKALAVTAEKAGVQFFYSTPGIQLVKENGKIVAAIGQAKDGKYLRFNAGKAVILCAGDYQNNDKMVAKYCPDVAIFDKKQLGRTGDGHLMGMWAGAIMEPIPHTKMMHDFDSGPMFDEPLLRVNVNGERFMNEEYWMEYINNILRSQPKPGWYSQIFDSNYVAQVTSWGGRPTPEAGLAPYFKDNPTHDGVNTELIDMWKANTLAELATQLGVPADTLAKTVADYNKACETGLDEKFGKAKKYLQPIAKAPFYGIRKHVRVSALVCGLIINEKAQCLDADGKVIPGLYAAGNNSGPFYGGIDYPMDLPGLSLGRAFTFGRIAGKNAAKG